MLNKFSYHVISNSKNGWDVVCGQNNEIVKDFDIYENAITFAIRNCIQEKCDLVIHPIKSKHENNTYEGRIQ